MDVCFKNDLFNWFNNNTFDQKLKTVLVGLRC